MVIQNDDIVNLELLPDETNFTKNPVTREICYLDLVLKRIQMNNQSSSQFVLNVLAFSENHILR